MINHNVHQGSLENVPTPTLQILPAPIFCVITNFGDMYQFSFVFLF